MLHRIFSISFTESKFNENLKNDHILQASNNSQNDVHYLRHRFMNQK